MRVLLGIVILAKKEKKKHETSCPRKDGIMMRDNSLVQIHISYTRGLIRALKKKKNNNNRNFFSF